MRTTDYIHAGTGFAAELGRLQLLETRYDEGTIRRIGALGPLTGARCLEVGAGAGSVVRWLAGEVGAGGHVVATDLDPRFLAGLEGPNVEVRRHDILADDIEDAAYDLVHCRALLLHLPDPNKALARMFAALRPGGLLVVEDADFVSMVACDPAHPHSAAFDRLVRSMLLHVEGEQSFDPWFGRRLPGLVIGLGVVDAGHEATVAARRGGSPEAALHRVSIAPVRAALVAGDLVTPADVAAFDEATSDPSFAFFDAVSVAAWGRRPTDHNVPSKKGRPELSDRAVRPSGDTQRWDVAP